MPVRLFACSVDARLNFGFGVNVMVRAAGVYLYCASEGLATVVRGSIPRNVLAPIMKLGADQSITLAQSVGYPKK